MKPGTMIRRRSSSPQEPEVFFGGGPGCDQGWIALVLGFTPPCHNNYYYVIEAYVTPENAIMKTYLTHEEVETLIEVVQ